MTESGHRPDVEPIEGDLFELVNRCIAGDEVAWRAFDAHCRRELPAYVRSFRLPSGWVGELVSDFLYFLFADECQGLRTYQPCPGSRFNSWLRVCFRHFTLRWIRRVSVPHRDPSADPVAILDAESPVHCTDAHLLLGFERVFHRLSERDQRLLSLRLDGCPYDVIGEQLAMNRGAVAVAMQRLRERLRVLLSSEVLDLGPPMTSSGEGRTPQPRE